MPIYWTLKSVPELAALPRAERRQAWRRVYNKTLKHWQTWVGLGACAVCAGAGSYLGSVLGLRPVGALIGAAIGGGIGGFVFSQVAIHVARRYYAHLLAGR